MTSPESTPRSSPDTSPDTGPGTGPAPVAVTPPQTILVAGGAGFLGSHLCDRLLAEGHRVLCLDDLSTGNRANIAHLAGEPRFAFHHHDITRPLPPTLEARLAAEGVAAICNLACPASPPHYQRDPVRTLRVAIIGTLELLELARRLGCGLLQASTSEIYGDPDRHPQDESYSGNVSPIGRRACYDEGKRAAETACLDYHRQHGVPVRVARIFNTYGPRMLADDGRVVSTLIVQALAGGELTINGDGSQTRAFCHVDDMVEGLLRLLRCPAAVGLPVNLGNPQELRVLDLAREILRQTGSTATLGFRPLPQDDPRQRCPDITRARTLLGWSPTIPLAEGLARTIPSFAALQTAPAPAPR